MTFLKGVYGFESVGIIPGDFHGDEPELEKMASENRKYYLESRLDEWKFKREIKNDKHE